MNSPYPSLRMNSTLAWPMSRPLAASRMLPQASGEHPVRRPSLQHRFHHQEGVGHLGPAQHEHAGPLGLLHQLGDDAVFLFEQPPHAAGQQLFKPAQAGLVPVGGGEGVAHVQIPQRRQLAHHLGLGLLGVGQLQVLFKQGLLLGAKAHVVQQQRFPVLQFRMACRARGPHTSSTHFTSRPSSWVSTWAWGLVV